MILYHYYHILHHVYIVTCLCHYHILHHVYIVTCLCQISISFVRIILDFDLCKYCLK